MKRWCEWCDIEEATVFVSKKYKQENKFFSGWCCKACAKELNNLDKYCSWKNRTPWSIIGKAFRIKLRAKKAEQARKDNNIIRKTYGNRIKCV